MTQTKGKPLDAKDVHLLIVPDFHGCPDGFRETLLQEGFSTELFGSLEEVTKEAVHHSHPLLIANCGNNEDGAIEFAKKLVAQKSLSSIPTLLFGANATGMERALERFCKIIVTLDTPFLRREWQDAIRYLMTNYPEESSQDHDPLSDDQTSQALPSEDLPLTEQNIQTLVFSQLSQLQHDDFGGTQFKNKIEFQELESLGLLPEVGPVRQEVEKLYVTLPRWPREHMCRTAFISDSFHKALALPLEKREICRDAALLMYVGFSSQTAHLLQQNYLRGEEGTRTDISSKLKDSALHILGEVERSDIARIVTLAARYIGEEESPDDSLDAISASLLVGAELVDRSCFEDGYWNPRAAYTFIRATSQGRLSHIHPLAAASIMKFLSEALVHMPKTFLVKQMAMSNKEFQQRAKENKEYDPETHEEKITLDNLEPGMQLSQPIYSYDGRKILSGHIQLDQDLIWRLWRLSAIRPMNTPLVVKKDSIE